MSDPLIAHQATSMLVPLLALLGTSLITGLFAADIDLLYAARIVAAIVPLWIWRAELRPLARRPSAGSALIGALVFAVWFVFTERENAHGDQLRAEVEALGGALGGLWIATRVLGSVLVVPVAEELAFRAYLLRRLVAPDFASVPMGMLKVGPLILSSLAFGLLHGDWIAGSAAGLGYGLAQVRGGRVTDAITAHAVTNALIALDVLLLGSWAQW